MASELQCHLDYETRCHLKLEDVGAINYAKEADIFCLAYKINDGPVRLWVPERGSMPANLWHAFKHATLVAHNASFERAVTKWALTRYDTITKEQRKLLMNLKPSDWRCTAAKAAASSLPRSLEMGAAVLGLASQKDMAGNKLIKKYCKPRKPTKNNPSRWWNDPTDLKKIYEYCKTDVQCEYELDQALPDLSPYEQSVWELDQKINDRGILIDIPTVKTILKMISEEMHNVNANVHRLSGGTIDTAGQRAKILEWVNSHGADMPDLKAPSIRDKLLTDNIPSRVQAMLKLRQAGSKTSTGKYIAMIHGVGADHRARELLLYNGAVPTARWAGKRIQVQNFPKPTIKGFSSDEAIALIQSGGLPGIRKKYGANHVMDCLVSSVRGMLIASTRKELFGADYSQVEARLAFWVAGHEEGLQAFRDGVKLYEMMAAEVFDMEVDDVTKDGIERFIGKQIFLGAIYGVGWKKFLQMCHSFGVKDVTEEMAKKAVYTYRRVHHPIPQLWKNLEEAAIAAVLNPGSKHKTSRVVFYTHGNWLSIKLPSGRRLRYFKPCIKQKQLAGGRMVPEIRYEGMEAHQWRLTSIWGGIFCNHIVQGIARDLMAHGMMAINDAGYEVLLSIHDEVLSERTKGEGSVEEYKALMTKLPDWAKGAPIEATCYTGLRYRK
jgi:Mesyanzhinovviridae DNA polymerase I